MTAIVYHPIYTKHVTPRGHPECAERVLSIQKALQKSAIPGVEWLVPRSGSREDLLLCHSAEYIALVQKEVNECKGSFFQPIRLLSTGDVTICTDSFEAALYAVGGVLTACDWVCENKGNVFVIARPPGHHATKNQGMGFCIFNNVACGARYVQKKYGLKRVLIIDWDVHHGNGTQDIFNDDPSVLYFSTHQKGIYPGTGIAAQKRLSCALQ